MYKCPIYWQNASNKLGKWQILYSKFKANFPPALLLNLTTHPTKPLQQPRQAVYQYTQYRLSSSPHVYVGTESRGLPWVSLSLLLWLGCLPGPSLCRPPALTSCDSALLHYCAQFSDSNNTHAVKLKPKLWLKDQQHKSTCQKSSAGNISHLWLWMTPSPTR